MPSSHTPNFPPPASHQINVAMVVDETEAEGPGRRMAVWVQGCPFRCPGCCNPHMLDDRVVEWVSVAALLERLAATPVEGISLLGGEPFAQAAPLAAFAAGAKSQGKSVMVFSGYCLNELQARDDEGTRALLQAADILVDGRYDAALRTTSKRWVGSENQTMHFLTDRYLPTDPRFAEANTVEIRMVGETLTLNGWPVDGAKTFPLTKRPKRTP